MINDKDVSLNRSIKMWDNIPLDDRAITKSLNELDEYINYPYIGMIFYSEFEDDYYKVLSLEDGYRLRTGEIRRAKDIQPPNVYPLIKGYFIGSYEQYTLKGNSKTMIKKAYIDKDGFLHIVFYDDQDTNVGYVIGDPGYCPQIKENEFNDMTTLRDLIYKLDITYCDEITHLKNTITTENLIGPYVVDISDEIIDDKKTGYTIFTLNTGDTYKIGPYGIKSCELVPSSDGLKQNLIIHYNDGTQDNLGNVRGENGTSVNILGTLKSEKDLPLYANNGEAYIIGKYLYFYFNGWKNVGKIVGEDGTTPDISLRYSIIKANPSDGDIRDTLKIQFYNGTEAIEDPIKIRLPYSPDISILSNNEKEYRVRIHGVTNYGIEFTIDSPNLKGKDGTSITIRGSINDYTELLQYVDNVEIGDSYIVDNPSIPNDGHLWTYIGDTSITDEKHFNGFLDVGKIKGPAGDNGSDGQKGDDGYTVKFRVLNGWIQYCYVDSNNHEVSDYINLVELKSITGPAGLSPEVTVIEEEESTILKIIDATGVEYTSNLRGKNGNNGNDGEKGENGYSMEMKYENNIIYYRYYITNDDGTKSYPEGSGYKELASIPKISAEVIENGMKISIDESTYYIRNGKAITLRYNNSNGYLEWQYIGDTTWQQLMAIDAITGADGKNMEVGSITTETLSSDRDANVSIIKNESLSNLEKNVYDFIFQIPKGEKGDNGIDGSQGIGITLIRGIYDDEDILTDLEITTTNPKDNTTEVYNISVGDIKGNGITSISVKSYDSISDILTLTINYDKIPSQDINISGLKGKKGDKGDNGIGIASIISTKNTESSAENIITITLSNGETKTFSVYNGAKGEKGDRGSAGEEIELRTFENVVQWKYVNEETWNDLFTLEEVTGPKGDKGDDGREIELQATDTMIQWRYVGVSDWTDLISIETITGPKGDKGDDGREIELQATDTMIQWRYIGDELWKDLIELQSIKGKDGLDAEVSIIENENNNDRTYKLDISYTSKGETVAFTTPNLKGGVNELYKILESLPEKDIDNTLDKNHIYLILKDNITEITNKEANYDKYIILNIAEDKTVTWEKIETTEASGNILVLINGDGETEATLPDIEFASTNFIYCLLTPEYQRGLNIGLTNDNSANKNFYEEWIVIETETEKKWELLGPQIYRISASMIDYIWKFADKFTVYDDWDIASDIPEYQKKHYGDATPLNNFIFRLVPSGSTYNLILVKEVSGGKINKLSIAPQYKVKLNGTTYTCTVTELDGTYNDSYTYYESDSEGNVSIKTYGTEEDFGTQSVFSGVEVYGVYVADTVKKITRGFLYTSNMSAYHIPYDLEIIGDYAFYSTKSPTVQFEKLINNGKDVEAYPLEESKVKAIGVHAFDGNSNLAFLIRNEDGTTKDSNIVKTPATLKKIGDYAFYNTRIATLDTNLSSNLYIGDHSFVQCVHGGQTLSPTTYYTDATFLGVNGLTHDTINYSSAGVSNWFEGQEHAGHNYNFDSGHETDVLHVTLTSVDPDWSLQ